MPLRPLPLTLTVEERLQLMDLAADPARSERLRQQARILLLGEAGSTNADIAAKLGLTRSTVLKWRRRFREARMQALGPERDPREEDRRRRRDRLEGLLRQPAPSPGGWTVRALAEAAGLSLATVQRTLAAGQLAPNPRAGRGEAGPPGPWRVQDLVGLHLDRPWHALVLEVAPAGNTLEPPPERPRPADPAWMLHLLMRSLEGAPVEAGTPPSALAFWRFLRDLPAARPGQRLWCLTDAPWAEAGWGPVSLAREDLHVQRLPDGRSWAEIMRSRVLPRLQGAWREGRGRSLAEGVQALEDHLYAERTGAFTWCPQWRLEPSLESAG